MKIRNFPFLTAFVICVFIGVVINIFVTSGFLHPIVKQRTDVNGDGTGNIASYLWANGEIKGEVYSFDLPIDSLPARKIKDAKALMNDYKKLKK